VIAAVAAGIGGTSPAPSVAATAAEVQSLNHTNDQLRRQLAKERARTVRLVRAERVKRQKLATSYRRSMRRGGTVDHALEVAAATYGVPESRLRRVASCESTLRTTATNGRYVGLFQFGNTLWRQTPYRSFARTDPYAASLAASWAFSRGMSSHWPFCGRR
jgi:hypothetical protein